MIKTGKRIGFIYLLIFALGFLSGAQAQDISVSAALTETNIFAGESVRLDVTISGQSLNSIERPEMPNTPGLRWLSGSTSQSTNYSYINGRPSVSYTYGYSFIAQSPGSYTFPTLSIEVNGEQFETSPISFKVLDPENIDQNETARSPDIYVRLEPSTDNPVVGEQVIASVVLYFKNEVEVSSYQPSPGWKAEGFWKEDLENRQQARTTSTLINGVRYQRAVLLQQAIFPTKSGELTLSPFDVVVQVRKRNRRRDIFSFGLGQERMELSSLPVTVSVRPLPDVDNAVFSGAVGKFEISRTLEPSEAFVGESVEIKTSITGQGNIPLIVKPEYNYPEALELYDPQESSSITRNNQEIGGSKTFTDIVIARNEGNYVIPEQRFAYYDPDLKRYRNITLPLLTLEVKRDPRLANSSTTEYRFEITPMTGLANWVSSSGDHLHQKTWVWLLLFLPVASLAGAFVIRTYTDRMNNDTAFARSQKAKEKALNTIVEAENAEDIKTGYHHIEKALIQFVTDKLDLPQAGLSIQELSEAIKDKGDSESAKELKRLLDKCETISYAPNTSQEGLNTDIERARNLIKKVGKIA